MNCLLYTSLALKAKFSPLFTDYYLHLMQYGLRNEEPYDLSLIHISLLWCLKPRLLPLSGWKKELLFAGAGLTGVTLYFLLENIALTYTFASNAVSYTHLAK